MSPDVKEAVLINTSLFFLRPLHKWNLRRQKRSDYGLHEPNVQFVLLTPHFSQQLLRKFTFIQNISTDP